MSVASSGHLENAQTLSITRIEGLDGNSEAPYTPHVSWARMLTLTIRYRGRETSRNPDSHQRHKEGSKPYHLVRAIQIGSRTWGLVFMTENLSEGDEGE